MAKGGLSISKLDLSTYESTYYIIEINYPHEKAQHYYKSKLKKSNIFFQSKTSKLMLSVKYSTVFSLVNTIIQTSKKQQF